MMRTPRAIDIEITTRCNLRCTYCNHFTSPGDVNQDLPSEEWIKFFEELNLCAVTNVSIQGGEPFCRKDIRQLLDAIVANRMRFDVLSNGGLISDEIAAYLQSTGRCDRVQLSVDGSEAHVHDLFRGKGAFDKAIKAIKLLQSYKIPVSVRVTIHKQNVTDLEAIADLLLNHLNLKSFSTNSVSPFGLGKTNADRLLLNIEERVLAMEILTKLDARYPGRIIASSGPLADARRWTKMEKAKQENSEPFQNGGHLTACGCVMSRLAVRADGVMVPCVLMGHIQLGRINNDDLKDTWQNHPELQRIRNRRTIPLNEFKFCNNCDYINYCTGNCPASAYAMLKTDRHPSPTSCLKRFYEAGGKLPTEGRRP